LEDGQDSWAWAQIQSKGTAFASSVAAGIQKKRVYGAQNQKKVDAEAYGPEL
jgi:hypothetical protein